MLESIALVLILLFGLATSAVCLYGIYAPRQLMTLVTGIWNKPSGLTIAVLVRTVLGITLIFAASSSSYPRTFFVLGLVAVLAAIGILLAGRKPIDRIIAWGNRFPASTLRAWLGFGLLLGLFLIYAALGSLSL